VSSLPPPEMPRFDNGGQNSLNPTKDRKAIGSLACAILGLIVLGIVFGAVAIWLGLVARKNIKLSQGALTGSGMAMAGIVLGGLDVLFTLVLITQ
jgi:hypothetical protein